ncbi:hypothetical protein [Gallibacterium anatis]|uniref:hypothetical protein n=1 Tax=Gallibacterium anatis TaxID=750 RepID=UPI00255002B8|nr:hypothetical protein [Gallibacterium anatis]WIM82557.1 hypothetical protein QP019_02535 [Gallibacterium anatis]
MDFHIHNVEQLNNINQAHFHQAEKAIDKNSPHIVICPQCGGESYRFNEYCYNGKCTFGIKAHFNELERIAQEQEYEKQKGLCSLIGFIGFAVSIAISYIGSQWFDNPKMALWFFGGIIWLFIWLKSAEQQ